MCAYVCVWAVCEYTYVNIVYDIRVFVVGGGHDRALSPDSFQGPHLLPHLLLSLCIPDSALRLGSCVCCVCVRVRVETGSGLER